MIGGLLAQFFFKISKNANAKKLVKTMPLGRFAGDLPSLPSNPVSVDPFNKCIIFGPLWEEVAAGGKPSGCLFVSAFSVWHNRNFFKTGQPWFSPALTIERSTTSFGF